MHFDSAVLPNLPLPAGVFRLRFSPGEGLSILTLFSQANLRMTEKPYIQLPGDTPNLSFLVCISFYDVHPLHFA